MYRRRFSYALMFLILLMVVALAFHGCSNFEEPEQVAFSPPPNHDTGAIYSLPGELPASKQLLSSNQFVNWQRYPAEEQTWLVMTDATAYYRDVVVGGQTYISGAADGETWSASAVRPDGSTISWGAITFYSEYNGQQNCFVSPYWYICGATSLYVLWYTNAQCVETGQWTMRFFNNGVQFHEGTFKTLPQIPPGKVPLYNQLAYSDHYDDRCWRAGVTPRSTTVCNTVNTEEATIAQLGCWLTGACMILGYHGVTVDPPTLNSYLGSHGGYQNGNVDGKVVARYAREQGTDVYYAGWGALSALGNRICSRGPQLAHVRKPGRTRYHHFVTVTGENEERTTYLINDPAGGAAITLTDKYQDIKNIRMFEGPEYVFRDNLCGITISFHSPGELMITDPDGLRTGYDPLAGLSYDEIPNGSYVDLYLEDPLIEDAGMESKVLEIVRPQSGEYTVSVTGTGHGTYDLSIRGYDVAGEPSTAEFFDIPIATDAVHSYAFDFDSVAGSEIDVGGGFDGGGQRPRDVNKFLSYGTISSSRVSLPLGDASFGLLILYGATVIPGTFLAELDGVDVSGLFAPAAGTSELVEIPLHVGRNVLKLSIEGNLPTRTARDTDRIVFLVDDLLRTEE